MPWYATSIWSRGRAGSIPSKEGRSRPRAAHLSAVWGRNRALCVNVLIHGHLCVCGFGRCRRVAHRYTFICQESVRNSGYRSPQIAGMDAPSCRHHGASGRDGPYQLGGKSLMSIHHSHICHVGGADQGHFLHPPRNSRFPRTIESDIEQANDSLRRMAILAVLEGGLPACRKATRTASLPTSTVQLPDPTRPNPTQPDPTRPKRPGRRGRSFKLTPTAEEATAGCGRNRAGRTVRMVGDDAKQRSDSLTVSQTHDLRPNR